jgi:hypothetical protein
MGEKTAHPSPHRRRVDYTQVKISIAPGLANAFKEACVSAGVSMASVLTGYMADFCGVEVKQKPTPDLTTRRKRKAAVKRLARQLCMIMAAEGCYLENVPENIQGSIVSERAENFISLLGDALEILDSVE